MIHSVCTWPSRWGSMWWLSSVRPQPPRSTSMVAASSSSRTWRAPHAGHLAATSLFRAARAYHRSRSRMQSASVCENGLGRIRRPTRRSRTVLFFSIRVDDVDLLALVQRGRLFPVLDLVWQVFVGVLGLAGFGVNVGGLGTLRVTVFSRLGFLSSLLFKGRKYNLG